MPGFAAGTVALVDRGWPETGRVTVHRAPSVFAGFRFPPGVISVAVRWYLRYDLSYRDVEELLAERGVTVDHVTIYRWVQRFTPEFIEAARPCRHAPGSLWGSIIRSRLARLAGLRSSLSDHLDGLLARALPARRADGAGPA